MTEPNMAMSVTKGKEGIVPIMKNIRALEAGETLTFRIGQKRPIAATSEDAIATTEVPEVPVASGRGRGGGGGVKRVRGGRR